MTTTLDQRRVPGLSRPVSVIGAGCWTIGGAATNQGIPIGWDHVDADQALAGLVRAHQLGVTLYDTADVYGLGRSERLLGRLLQAIPRHQVVVSSKVGYFAGTAAHPYQPDQMRRQLDTTLANLGTDRLDLYFLHSDDFGDDDTHLQAAIGQMRAFRDQGLVGTIGMRAPHEFAAEWADSPETGWRGVQAARFLHLFTQIRPDVVTARYSLLSPTYRDGETDIFAFARHHRFGVLIKQALAQGLLVTDLDRPAVAFSNGDHRSRDPLFRPPARAGIGHIVLRLRDQFGPAGLHRAVLRYAIDQHPDAAVLVGFRNAAQIQQTVTCLGDPLTGQELAALRATAETARRLLRGGSADSPEVGRRPP
ncbi:aldo/keto reductase [Actinomadura graeca]|uniref:Aldo/keto reductase n=1 Tax=Actinomadura graeca TaxID=2750812 RepID=A0ABX8R4W8_9ACTN|nr:aldo/keto reductase [Actinomadura graeca]QXJ25873.1 aldo/keto reductase [Actinomadura graeca]